MYPFKVQYTGLKYGLLVRVQEKQHTLSSYKDNALDLCTLVATIVPK